MKISEVVPVLFAVSCVAGGCSEDTESGSSEGAGEHKQAAGAAPSPEATGEANQRANDDLTPAEMVDLVHDVADAGVVASRLATAGRAAVEGRPVEAIAPLLGRWEIDADWAWGEKLWGRSDYTPVLGGAFVEARAVVREGDGEPYHRYTSIIRVDPATGEVTSTDFASDGRVQTTIHTPAEGGGLQSEWFIGDVAIRERIDPQDESMPWKVWMKPPGDEGWDLVMDDAWTATDAPMPEHTPPELADALSSLAPLIGDWTINAEWAGGEPLIARATYSVDVGGQFIRAATYPKDPEGPEYHRYLSFFAAADAGFTLHGFDYASNVTATPIEWLETDPPAYQISSKAPDGSRLRQRVDLTTNDTFRWRVWTSPAGADNELQIMDGQWQRVREVSSVSETHDPA